MKKYVSVFVLVLAGYVACGQKDVKKDLVKPLRVGEGMPEFVLDVPGKKKAITNASLRGKPAIITFFSTGCVGSFRTLPKVDAVYRQFKDQVNFITVGRDKDSVQHAYKRFKHLYDIEMPVLFDSGMFEMLGLKLVPAIIWITKDGIVQTVSHEIGVREVQQLINGETFPAEDVSPEGKRKAAKEFDPQQPLLMSGNGAGLEVLQHSVLTRWQPGIRRVSLPGNFQVHPMEKLERLQLTRCGLTELYRIAYVGRASSFMPKDTARYGKWQFLPILEVTDPSVFNDISFGRNEYCYSHTLPAHRRTPEVMMEVMQQDLKLNFGYEASIETRRMNYYRLVVIDSTKIRKATLDRKRTKYHEIIGGWFPRITIANLIFHMDHNTATSWEHNLPVLDETGIDYDIDIRLDAVTTSLEDFARSLRKAGLDLVLAEKDFKVLVIRDAVDKKIK